MSLKQIGGVISALLILATGCMTPRENRERHLMRAARAGDTEYVRTLLEMAVDANARARAELRLSSESARY